jgi:gluconolactonase
VDTINRMLAHVLWLSLLAADPPVQEVAVSPTFTEGPVFDARGNLFFTHNHGIFRLTPDGRREDWVRDAEAGFNGHKVLADGTHLVCASKKGAIWRMSPAGEYLGEAVKGQRAPNDLTLDGRGGFYFTDPGGSREKPIGTVHYVDAQGRLSTVAEGLRVPNGLVISGRYLYVAETVPNRILRYAINAPGRLGAMQVFATLPGRDGHEAAPDGLAIDARGNLYVAHLGTGSVIVLNKKGKTRHRWPITGVYDVSNLVIRAGTLYVTGAVGHRARTEGRLVSLRIP